MNSIICNDDSNKENLFGLFGGLLSEPCDSFNARITPSGRQVIKVTKGTEHISATRYSTGTIYYTRSIRPNH